MKVHAQSVLGRDLPPHVKLSAVNLAGLQPRRRAFISGLDSANSATSVQEHPCAVVVMNMQPGMVLLRSEIYVVFESKPLYSKMSAYLRECCTANVLRRLSNKVC